MAFEESLRSITLEADASIGIPTGVPGTPGAATPNSGMQFRWVKVTGPLRAGLSSTAGAVAATDNPIGVLQNKPQGVGDASAIGFSGVSMVELGGTVAPGDSLKLDGTSRPVKGVAGTDKIVAVALLGGAVGQLAPALIQAN